jgi:hypothetical protein
MTAEPHDYDREFTVAVNHRARRRLGVDTERGDVVRHDHDGTSEDEFAHDVTEKGLHIDILRDGEKEATEYISPPQPAAIALDCAEDHLFKNLE